MESRRRTSANSCGGAAPAPRKIDDMMNRLLLGLACAAVLFSECFAAVVALPGSTPQQARAGEPFPNSIGVRVTDEQGVALAGAVVWWFVRQGAAVVLEDTSNCFYEFGFGQSCSGETAADGTFQLPRFRGTFAGTELIRVVSTRGSTVRLGETVIELKVEPRTTPVSLHVVSGAEQRAVIGTAYAQPVVMRVIRADGTPMAGATVRFQGARGVTEPWVTFARQTGLDASRLDVVTDSFGYASTGPIVAGWGLGEGSIIAEVFDEDAKATVSETFAFTNTNAQGGTFLSFQDMWWSGSTENGWGMSIAQHGERIFGVVYVYDEEGNPTWYVAPGGRWAGGLGARFQGTIYSPRSTPFFAYDTRSFNVGWQVGSIELAFNGPEVAYLYGGFPLNDGTSLSTLVTKRIVRQDFSTSTPLPLQGLGDMWWGGLAQNGWGIAIMEQPGGLFSVWFTYGADGRPTWFVMPEGRWIDGSTFSGTIYRTRSSPWVSREYDASRLQVGAVGSFTYRFEGRDRALFEYEVDGRRGVLPLERQPF